MGVKIADDFTGARAANGSKSDRDREDHEDYLRALQQDEPLPHYQPPPESKMPDQDPEAPSSDPAAGLEDRLLPHELAVQRARKKAHRIIEAEERGDRQGEPDVGAVVRDVEGG
jgi:hypothetical protein